jgi:hypothetical protein
VELAIIILEILEEQVLQAHYNFQGLLEVLEEVPVVPVEVLFSEAEGLFLLQVQIMAVAVEVDHNLRLH